MPRIRHKDDVFEIGTISQAKAFHDKRNPYSPYVLQLHHQERAKIASFVGEVAPLCRVTVHNFNHFAGGLGDDLTADQLTEEQ